MFGIYSPAAACTHWVITIQFLGAADHCVCVSVCVADEVDPILLAEHGSFRSEKGRNIKPVTPLMNHNEHAAEFTFWERFHKDQFMEKIDFKFEV